MKKDGREAETSKGEIQNLEYPSRRNPLIFKTL